MAQAAKFLGVGIVNTAVDFAVLNGLIFLTGIATGAWFSVFKAISFSLATLNSYALNKRWTFFSQSAGSPSQFARFIAINAVGLLINVLVASLIANSQVKFGISPHLFANFAALGGVLMSMSWNFIGYKFFVFKS